MACCQKEKVTERRGACATDAQRALLERFGAQGVVDVHCHCLPGLDDGPGDIAGAIELCKSLADDGVTDVIATPHQLGRYEGKNSPATVRIAVASLNSQLNQAAISLTVHPGGDVRVHERMAELLEADEVLTVADGGHYVMLELPHEFFVDITPLIAALSARQVTAVITHPERHDGLVRRPQMLAQWVGQGAVAQVTAGSLLGEFGDVAERAGWEWLGRGLAALVASDAHDITRRPPRMGRAIEAISRRVSHVVARTVCIENPSRLLTGESLLGRGVAAMGVRR